METGLKKLDNTTEGGWRAGELMCFSASTPRPLYGPRKSNFAFNIIRDHLEKGGKVLFTCYEGPPL